MALVKHMDGESTDNEISGLYCFCVAEVKGYELPQHVRDNHPQVEPAEITHYDVARNTMMASYRRKITPDELREIGRRAGSLP